MWPDKASLNIQTHGQYHALKTQRIGSEKTYGPKIHKCNGPRTLCLPELRNTLCGNEGPEGVKWDWDWPKIWAGKWDWDPLGLGFLYWEWDSKH